MFFALIFQFYHVVFIIMEANDTTDKYNIKAVMRCFQILDLAAASEHPLTIQNVCESLEINTNMAFRLLASLVASGYMVKDDHSGHYATSLKALQLSRNALVSLEIRKLTMPYLELLWNQYPKSNINMGVFNLDEILVVDRIDSLSLPRTYFTPGKALPFHCTGLGKVLTCEMPEEQLDELIAKKGLKSFTSRTITDSARLKDELKQVKADQIARDRNEYILKDNCNAAPIRGRDGRIIAAISLSAFENYMSIGEIEDTIPAVQDTARKISYMAGYHSGLM